MLFRLLFGRSPVRALVCLIIGISIAKIGYSWLGRGKGLEERGVEVVGRLRWVARHNPLYCGPESRAVYSAVVFFRDQAGTWTGSQSATIPYWYAQKAQANAWLVIRYLPDRPDVADVVGYFHGNPVGEPVPFSPSNDTAVGTTAIIVSLVLLAFSLYNASSLVTRYILPALR